MENPFEELENHLISLKKKGYDEVRISISEIQLLLNLIKNQQEKIWVLENCETE